MGEDDKWTEMRAYAVVRSIIAQDPQLLSAVVNGIMSGQRDAMDAMREKLTWANMALDSALLLHGKRQTPEFRKHLEFCVGKYLTTMGHGANKVERDFLDELAKQTVPA